MRSCCSQASQVCSRRGRCDVEAHASWPPPGYALRSLEEVGLPVITVSIHCAPEMSEIDCIGRIESFWPKFVRGW